MAHLNLREIGYQTPLRDKPVRFNFADLQNYVNNLSDRQDTALTPPAGSEITDARDYHTVLRNRLRSASKVTGNRLVLGGLLQEQGTPDMTVHITAGEAIVDGTAIAWPAGDSGTVTAPGSNTRLDYIVANSDNTISILAGTAAAIPVFPGASISQLILGALVIKSTTTAIREGIELFTFRDKCNRWYPDFYYNANTTFTADLNYNNLIIDGCRFDTAGYIAKCQGIAHIVGLTNGGSGNAAQLNQVRADSSWTSPTQYICYNYGGDYLTAGTPGKGGNSTYYKAGNGNNAYPVKIKAFSIYLWGTNNFTGAIGNNGTNNNIMVDAVTLGSGEDGGDGGNSGNVFLEAIQEIINYGTISGNGAAGGNGKNCSAGTQVNLGGQSGKGGTGSAITLKAAAVTAGTYSVTAGATGTAGVGSGGATNNGNGSTPAGTNGSYTEILFDGVDPLPGDYAEWMRNIEE